MAIANSLRQTARFCGDRSGQVTLLFGLMLIPMLCAVGAGLDYGRQRAVKVRLDSALDGAVLSVASQKSNIFNEADVRKALDAQFRAQAATAAGPKQITILPGTPGFDVKVTTTVDSVSIKATYTALLKTSLTNFLRFDAMEMKGTATAARQFARYTDFYLLLDTSGSMGLPTTQDGQDRLAKINPDNKNEYPSGCQFACHYPGSKGYDLSRSANPRIDLRADSVGLAVKNLIAKAKSTERLPNQFRIGLYPFVNKVAPMFPTSGSNGVANPPVSDDLDAVASKADTLATYLDDGDTNGPWGAGGTHFDTVLQSMNNVVLPNGDGTIASKPRAFIFLVTDGVNNAQTYPFNGSQPALLDTKDCTPLTKAGRDVTLAILYTPYIEINPANHSFAGDEDGKVNKLIPSIPANLQKCASLGYFFTASTPEDINNALQTMFAQAVADVRLTD